MTPSSLHKPEDGVFRRLDHTGFREIPLAFKDLVDINAISEHTVLKVVIDGNEVATTVREATFVPAGTKWSFESESVYSRAYIFANGGGIGDVLTSVGSKYESVAVPQPSEEGKWDESKLSGLESVFEFTVA